MTVEFVDHSTVELVKFSGGGDEAVARAAWVSTVGEESRTKDTGQIQGLINYLYKNKHMSPFEHDQFTFYIKCPIFVAREFHRHRTMSYNEISGRYTDMQPRFYVPARERNLIQHGKVGAYTFVPGTDEQYVKVIRTLQKNSEKAWENYIEQKQAGVANEVARMVLPLNLMTEFYATVSPRNLMQFLDLRTEGQALYEIRDVANQMEELFKQEMPLTHTAYRRFRTKTIDIESEVE